MLVIGFVSQANFFYSHDIDVDTDTDSARKIHDTLLVAVNKIEKKLPVAGFNSVVCIENDTVIASYFDQDDYDLSEDPDEDEEELPEEECKNEDDLYEEDDGSVDDEDDEENDNDR